MARPIVRYATTSDGLEIAYQVVGDGPLDVLIVPGVISNLDRNADYPFYGCYLRRFPRFARTIVLDKRGGGVSDRQVGSGSAEGRMDEVRAVMDAVGSERAALLGQIDGGPIALLFAATYPDRVSALVLVEGVARRTWDADYPEGFVPEEVGTAIAHFRKNWGTGRAMLPFTCDVTDEEKAVEALAVLERSVGTPRSVAEQLELTNALDARSALPLIEAPTISVHCPEVPPPFTASLVRWTADRIRGARYIELPWGWGSWDSGKQDAFVDIIEEFLTGQRPPVAERRPRTCHRGVHRHRRLDATRRNSRRSALARHARRPRRARACRG
jgi:pimeloyl-ACP methyl ester carboxylesterase